MSWTERAPGVFQRPLGGAEKAMAAVITAERPFPREPLLIHCIADFSAPSPSDKVVASLRDAWKALRLLKSPDIATTFADGIKYYKVPSPQELEDWLKRTFLVPQTGTPVQMAIREMQLQQESLPVCSVLPQPTSDGSFRGSIILFVSHWRSEASGCFMMINSLLDYASDLLADSSVARTALSEHILGSEAHLLTPAVEDMMMRNRQTTPEAMGRVEQRFIDYYSNFPSVDFPLQGSLTTAPSHLKTIQRIYAPATTSGIVVACRDKGLTVTSAVQAALLGAVWDVAGPEKRTRAYANVTPAAVRKRLPASSPFRDQGCWNAAQMLLITELAGQDFLTLARDLRSQYRLAEQDSWLREDMRETNERLMKPPSNAPPPEPVALAHFTSFGLLERDLIVPEHGGFKVGRVAAWADNVGLGFVLSLWTFKEKMNLQISWNASFHGDAQIQEVMDAMEGTLAAELGVEMVTVEVVNTEN